MTKFTRPKALICSVILAATSMTLMGCNPPGKSSEADAKVTQPASCVTQYKFTIDPDDVGATGSCQLTYCAGTWTMSFKGTYCGYTMTYSKSPYQGISGSVLSVGSTFSFEHAKTTAVGHNTEYHQGALKVKSIKKLSNNSYEGVLYLNPDPCTCNKCK